MLELSNLLVRQAVALLTDDSDETVNAEGMTRATEQVSVDILVSGSMADENCRQFGGSNENVAEEAARTIRFCGNRCT